MKRSQDSTDTRRIKTSSLQWLPRWHVRRIDTGTGINQPRRCVDIRSHQGEVSDLSGCETIRDGRGNDQKNIHNNRTEGWLFGPNVSTKPKEGHAEVLIEDEDSFKEQADVLFAIGRYLALADDLNKAKDYIRRAIKLNGNYRSEFLEDPAFDAVWESF